MSETPAHHSAGNCTPVSLQASNLTARRCFGIYDRGPLSVRVKSVINTMRRSSKSSGKISPQDVRFANLWLSRIEVFCRLILPRPIDHAFAFGQYVRPRGWESRDSIVGDSWIVEIPLRFVGRWPAPILIAADLTALTSVPLTASASARGCVLRRLFPRTQPNASRRCYAVLEHAR